MIILHSVLEDCCKAVVFNLFGGAEPQGCIPVALGTPAQISAQESKNILSIVALLYLLAEPPDCTGGALRFRGTPVENHWCRRSRSYKMVS